MARKRQFNNEQKNQLLTHARDLILGFAQGVLLDDDPNPHDLWEKGFVYFKPYTARYTDSYLKARREFTKLAAKLLKARSAHEETIRAMCQNAGQEYVKQTAEVEEESPDAVESAAKNLVDAVLAEAGKEYVHIEPNFLIRHTEADTIELGRVRSMRTGLSGANTPLSKIPGINLVVGNYPKRTFDNEGGTTLCMPASVWVVDVPATKENVAEEAKWLIDIAISLMRLASQNWRGHFPSAGALELHPTYPTISSQPNVTMEGDTAWTGGFTTPGWYEIDTEIAIELSAPEIQSRAAILFDPREKSLAQRVAQGLGWMTRGRQVSDRAERLLAFFTALEALLTSNDKNDPVTQTISRHVSVILAQDVKARIAVYNQIKGLYALRSAVVHAGRREVLGQDVIILQGIVETTFWAVLNRCDLTMSQEHFAQSLADASHGLRWEFAASEEQSETVSSQ